MPAPQKKPTPNEGDGFLRVWLIFWTLGVIPLDYSFVSGMWSQFRALDFPTAEGVLTRSRLKVIDGEDGPSYELDIAYDYEVGGQRYTGTRYCYAAMGGSSRSWKRVQRQLPVGARVPVFYDPRDPAEAVLRPGPTGMHLFMAWFATPFNVVAVGGWVWFLRRNRPEFDPTRHVRRTPSGWAVRTPLLMRVGVFAGVLLGITFVGLFVWGFGWGFDPPVPVIGTASVIALVVAAVVAAAVPLPWVEVDETKRVLRFSGGELPLDGLRAVVVDEEVKTSDGETTRRYHCKAVRTEPVGAETRTRVAGYDRETDAEAFADWLRKVLGLTIP